jgi:hypothetical protein
MLTKENMKEECCNQPNGIFKPLLIIIFFFIALFLFSKFGPNIPFSLLTQQKGEPLVVTEEGKATVVPDLALVSFGIEDNGTSLKDVQSSVDQKSKDLVSALKKQGVDEKDIKTISYNVYPNYDYQASPNRIIGYRVSINYQVKIQNLEKINDIVVAATGAGANQVGSISFDLKDETKAKALEEARQEAVTKAKAKAQGLARVAGITLGKIINIAENEGNAISPVPRPDIQAGTTEVTLSITISWEIR